MRELLRGVLYRPLFLPLAMLVWAIVGSACCALGPVTVILFSLCLPLLYGWLLVRSGITFRPGLLAILLLCSLLLTGTTARRVDRCRRAWSTACGWLGKKGRRVTFEARVKPFPRGSYRGWRLELVPLSGPLAGRGVVALDLPPLEAGDSRLPLAGDRVELTVFLRPLRPARHPFLRAGFRRRLLAGIIAVGRLDAPGKIRRVAGGCFYGRIESLRRRLEGRIFAAVGKSHQDAAAILAAVLLGSRDRLRPQVQDLFLDFGVYHLFAISGLHLAIVVGLMFWLGFRLVPVFLRRRWATGGFYPALFLTLGGLPFYILLTGCHLPVLRAGIMASLFLLALFRGRRQDAFSTLLLAAVIILWLWPQELFGLSFQLSFSAVAAIIWLAYRLPGWWKNGVERYLPFSPGPLLSGLEWLFYFAVTSLTISLVTMPWLLSQVHFISPYSLPANLILIPLFSFLIIPVGMGGVVAGVLPGGMELLLRPLAGVLDLLLEGFAWARSVLPARRLYGPTPSVYEILLLAVLTVLLLAWFSTRPGRRKGVAALLVVLLLAGLGDQFRLMREAAAPKLSVAAFVGRRPQALLVEMGSGQALLCNGGSWPGGFSLAEKVIAPYCWRRRISEIPVLVLTEPQKGLVGGLLFLVDHFRVREIWYHGVWSGYPPFRNFNRITREEYGVRWRKLASLSAPWVFNGIEIVPVGPPANDFAPAGNRSRTLLEMAPSLLFRYGAFRLLVWGGGRVDAGRLPRKVDLLALLTDPGDRLPAALKEVRLASGGWRLEPGNRQRPGAFMPPEAWAGARVHRVRRDGFIFLSADRQGRIDDRLPEVLISGCQATPE